MTEEMTDATRPIARPELHSGPASLGAFRLFERLGSGGLASVYRARRIGDSTRTDVALKRLHPHLAQDADAISSFVKEMHLACMFDHPVIRRVLSLCREPDELYMIMEFVDGGSLSSVLRRAATARRPLPLSGVMAVLHRLCGALHYAHEVVDETGETAGFVHRDVSPSNLIVNARGQLKLIDLGVARSSIGDFQTKSRLIKGKYGYMAPEVLWSRPFDRRADVFSIGVVAWEMLTLHKLYPVRDPPTDIRKVRARPVTRPSLRNPACPPELDAVVLRALDNDPTKRWPTCAAMAAALAEIAQRLDEPVSDDAIRLVAEVLEPTPPPFLPPPVPQPPAPSIPITRRRRIARGTPASSVPIVPPPEEPLADERREHRCWRGAVAGIGVGVLSTVFLVTYLGYGPPIEASTVSSRPVVVGRALVADAAVAALAAIDAGILPDAAKPPDAAMPPDAGPDPDAGWVSDVETADEPPLVDAAAVTRVRGRAPRSRSGTFPYRARLCIDAAGAVTGVDVLEGPERLVPRVAHALRRWRYEPYAGGAPVCFEIAARIQYIERGG